MRFDDRLLTVLNQPAEDRHDAAVRWRQLVDLVARAGANSDSPVVIASLEAIRNEAHNVEESLRAAAARAVAAQPLPLGLLEYFASDTIAVSAPVLAAASLDLPQWRSLRAVADEEARRFIDTLHPEVIAEPQIEAAAHAILEDQARQRSSEELGDAQPPYTPPSLHDVVERIEQRRRMRSGFAPSQAQGPSIESPALFRWECGPGGEIAWVEGAPRGALIGRSIARLVEGDGDRIDQDVVRAFAMRAPFRDGLLTVAAAGAVSGDWKISGVPAFEPTDGRFAGYRGVALREVASQEPPAISAPELLADPDSLRELVHEIKTPLNAIIGFAEIIEGQYLGPADRGYRERAHEIVRQARLLLTAIDDLDFAAKVRSSAVASGDRVDLVALLDREARELSEIARKRRVHVDVVRAHFEVPAATQAELADRLLFRLLNALVDLAQPTERLQLSADLSSEGARITIGRPAALKGMSDGSLFEDHSAETGRQSTFTLRLVRGLARIAGGDLTGHRDYFALIFPRS